MIGINENIKEVEEKLAAIGFELECYSPLEIRCNETGAFASNEAAEFILYHLDSNFKKTKRWFNYEN